MQTIIRRSARPSFGALILCGLILYACAGSAVSAGLVDVAVVNRRTGERLEIYRHEGKRYVAGRPGDSYAVELRNLSGGRLLTVLSVDGVNALTGQTADPRQAGYVIDGRRSYAINGWRKSLEDVAKFVFTDLPDSYAARSGRPDNVGVIGVAVFREKIEPRPPIAFSPEPTPSMRAAPARPSAEALAKAERRDSESSALERESQKLGTGHGEREYAPTRHTQFVRNRTVPDEVVTIYYDSRANLIARGIVAAPYSGEPKAFPGGVGFVPDLRG